MSCELLIESVRRRVDRSGPFGARSTISSFLGLSLRNVCFDVRASDREQVGWDVADIGAGVLIEDCLTLRRCQCHQFVGGPDLHVIHDN